MSSSSGNPWSDGENSFNQALRELLQSTPDYEVELPAENPCLLKLAWQTSTESHNVSDRNNILIRLRAADSHNTARRNATLQSKLNEISGEVKDVLHPSVVNDIEIILNHMSDKFQCLTSLNTLRNISRDFDHKKRYNSVHVDSLNQEKVRQLLSFAHDFYNFERKYSHIISKNGGITDRGDNTVEDELNLEDGILCSSSQASNGDRELLLNSIHALDTCENMLNLAQLLDEQFRKLTEFHREFKSHILKCR
jgi:hypothetical protein